MPPSLASFSLPHTMHCFLWGLQEWEPEPAHHYPCTRCLILWPFITIQASNETLLVSLSPDIRVLLQRLRYAISQELLHAHIGIITLDPEQTCLHRKYFFQGREWKLFQFFSLNRLCDIMIPAGEKGRPPKFEIHASRWKQCWAFFETIYIVYIQM